MTISLNWLRDYLGSDLTPDQIAVILTDLGLEVDRFERQESVRGGLVGVVVGHVLTCERHPDADRLSITTVDVGAEEALQIVCGAPNVAAGQKVLVATVGATLYPADAKEGFKIKKSKIRGVESLGMICAEDELGIGTSHDGIMVLAPYVKPGTPALNALNISEDYIIEIGLTPNRIDAASHWGVARDLAAWLRVHGKRAELSLPSVDGFLAGSGCEITVDVQDIDGAPRYSGVTISGIRIAPSPEWLQNRLRAIGVTPHNNVVDVTNYVLHETGQPLHAFDADKIEGGRVVVRTCPDGTPFTTLDGVERCLAGDDLMICDAVKPMCIAGVYGGRDSGVTEMTTAVFLESAYFNSTRIRRTARRHGLSTDASFRYERGADPNITLYALKRAALMISELAGGTVSSSVTDIYPTPIEDVKVELSLDRLNSLIGKDISRDVVLGILAALEIAVEGEQGDILHVAVPAYRVDVQREADLAEEILRVYGYNNVEIPRSLRSTVAYAPRPDVRRMREMVADMLSANGFNEAMSNSLTRESYYEGVSDFPAERCVRILNPLSSDLSVMRQTLIFSALEAAQLNVNHRNPNLKLFEFGNTYSYDAAAGEGLAPYAETARLALMVTGIDRQASWNIKPAAADIFYLRGVAEKILQRFGVDIYSLKTEEIKSDVFANALLLHIGGREFMRMGIVSDKLLKMFDLRQEVSFLEMDFGALLKATKNNATAVVELSRYPAVRRDLALLADRGTTFAALRDAAFRAEKKVLRNVSLFDVYEGDKLPADKKSYALAFLLEDKSKTLTDNEIERIMHSIADRLERDCGAVVRS